MTLKKQWLSILFLSCVTVFLTAQTSGQRYQYKIGDYNGIGKWYLGREIAHVMGYQGISWLERPEREKEERTSILLNNMDISSNDVIADIGAGSGYHVFKMASMASNGEVYAVDIQPEMLQAISDKIEQTNTRNITTILGSEDDVNLPENSIDKILMVDVYHEFSYPYEIMMTIRKALKSDGLIYLIEYRGEDSSVPIKTIHKMTETQSVKEMEAAGFSLKENIGNLPWQHCMIFQKKSGS